MADTPGLEPGAARLGGSSPPSRSVICILTFIVVLPCFLSACALKQLSPLSSDSSARLEWQISQEIQERRARIEVRDALVLGDFLYLLREEAGRRHPALWRAPQDQSEKYEPVFDANFWLGNYPEAVLYNLKPSPDHRKIAWSANLAPSQQPTLFIHDVSTQQSLIFETIRPYQMEWASADELIYTNTENFRPAAAYSLALKALEHEPKRLFAEDRADHYLELSKSKDGSLLFVINRAARDFSLLLRLSASFAAPFRLFYGSSHEPIRKVEHRGGKIYLLTGESPKIIEMSLSAPTQTRDLFLSQDLDRIENFDLFERALVLQKVRAGISWMEFYDGKLEPLHQIRARDDLTSFELALNPQYSSSQITFRAKSPTSEPQKFTLDLNSLDLHSDYIYQLLPSDYERGEWQAERLFARSKDGVKVPLTLLSPSLQRNPGQSKTVLLSAYGAYGDNLDLAFDADRVSYLKRGIDIAFAHVRGGGELGPSWHELGSQGLKENSFYDYIACAEKLRSLGYAKIVGYGRSAGALIQGFVLNNRPDLLNASILEMPFLDPLGSSLDLGAPHHAREVSEWGDPSSPIIKRLLSSYSPLQNVSAHPYPAILIISSQQDELVPSTQAKTFFERVKALRTNHADMRLVLEDGSSHSKTSFAHQQAKREALKLAFILAHN